MAENISDRLHTYTAAEQAHREGVPIGKAAAVRQPCLAHALAESLQGSAFKGMYGQRTRTKSIDEALVQSRTTMLQSSHAAAQRARVEWKRQGERVFD